MYMPDIHSCCQLSSENERLKKYIKKLRDQNACLKLELDAKRLVLQQTLISTRSIETQTDGARGFSYSVRSTVSSETLQSRKQKGTDAIQLSKLVALHDGLMRRHEKEVQSNIKHVETIATLTLKVNELEQKLRESQLSQANMAACKQSGDLPTSTELSSDLSCEHHRELVTVTVEKNKIEKKYKKLKCEMEQLSPGFFEEIEDIKYALQQSAQLNKEYEKALRRICLQFGLPYPHPERILES